MNTGFFFIISLYERYSFGYSFLTEVRSDAAGGWLSGIDNTAQQNVHFLSDAEDFSIVSEIIFGANFTSENRFSLKSSS